jgi:hypothetical protein
MAAPLSRPADFDPFEFTWIFRGTHRWSTWRILGLTFAIPAAVVLAAFLSGALGAASDAQLVDDVARIARIGPATSAPDFPLTRDFYSWTQAAAVMCGVVLLHTQWKWFSSTLSTLADNGAIVAPADLRSTVVSRALRIDRLVDGADPADALDQFMTKLMDGLRRRAVPMQIGQLLVSMVLAMLLVQGQQQHDLFQVLAPTGLSPRDRSQWAQDAYSSWWASNTDRHFVGHACYLLVVVYAIFMILNFHVVGILAAYVVIALYFLAAPSADWFDRDAHQGWETVSRAFQTVTLAHLLEAFTLTDVLIFIGARNFTWILPLLTLYVLVTPVYFLAPLRAFQRVEREAKRLRTEDLLAAATDNGVAHDDVPEMAPYVAEMVRCQAFRIRPLRYRRWSASTFFAAVFLPVALAVAQMLFEFRLGAG